MKACPGCGYELDGVPEVERRVRCPECGGEWTPVDFVPRRTMLRGALIGGVAVWGVALVVMLVLPGVMLPERAGPWVWRVGVVCAAVSVLWTAVGLTGHWKKSIWFDRIAVAGIVGLANAAGLFVAYVAQILMIAAGC